MSCITLDYYPTGNKQMPDSVPGSDYYAVHNKYHPILIALQNHSYYDFFLIDLDGNLIYSVNKKMDYAATSLKPYTSKCWDYDVDLALLVTFFAAYHYIPIFYSWVRCAIYAAGEAVEDALLTSYRQIPHSLLMHWFTHY